MTLCSPKFLRYRDVHSLVQTEASISHSTAGTKKMCNKNTSCGSHSQWLRCKATTVFKFHLKSMITLTSTKMWALETGRSHLLVDCIRPHRSPSLTCSPPARSSISTHPLTSSHLTRSAKTPTKLCLTSKPLKWWPHSRTLALWTPWTSPK